MNEKQKRKRKDVMAPRCGGGESLLLIKGKQAAIGTVQERRGGGEGREKRGEPSTSARRPKRVDEKTR